VTVGPGYDSGLLSLLEPSATHLAESNDTCPERERLLSLWTGSSNHVTRLLDEQVAAIRDAHPGIATLDERVRVARNAEVEACRAYYGHINAHECDY
jgi:hypothetical protein